ncbi:hypothetical protein CL634_02210, partial [bacterium]|nr:hypothetical protein [bacterium]
NLPNHAIPNCLPLEIGPRDLLIDPYLFGLWLGDGTKKTGVIATNFANGDSEWIQSSFEEKGYKLVRRNEYSFSIYGLQTELRTIGALKNKNIPDKYLWASRSQRLALLQGFMDSDGYVNPDRKQVSLTATRKEHAEAVAFLARSLGQKPTLKKYKRTEGCPGKTHDYSVSWTSTINPFRLPRKVATWEGNKISKLQNVSMRTIVSCEEIDPSPMRCITVDSSNAMYLCGKSLIPTHNTVAAALFDEMAFWRSEDAANPDREILAAIRPAMATIPESMLLCASSPYARRGALYDTWKRYYGEDNNRVLVWQAPSWIMNPSLSQEWLDEEFEKDAASARAEYGAEFRTDVENFINEEVLDACTPPHRFELPYIPEFNYVAFTDPSGGSKDSFTLAISHYDSDKDKCILDAIREVQPPFSPEEVTREFAALIRQYHITTVIGDRYGGEWPRERFMEHGVVYEPADKVKSEVYRELLPLINSGKVELLEHKRMVNQFLLLERRTRRGGKDSIDHPPNTHDDIANVVAGALVYSDQGEMVDIW